MFEGPDQRRYNAPLHEEVAAVFSGDDGAPPGDMSIVVHPRNAPLRTISIISSIVDPLVYPLLFPRGDPGWDRTLPHVAERASRQRNHVTQLEYYAYRLAIRRGFSALHLSGKLFQQFIVDAYTKVEGNRLNYHRFHQQEIRADSYQGLVDHLENAAQQRDLNAGQVIVLPSSFSGSPRAMHQLYLDAMAVVAKHGKPDTFLTFTCNPKWREITENLLPNQRAHDRPDLLTRVFRMKLAAMKKEIMKDGILGMVVARVDVIEFQKRGLPHAHLLIHFEAEFKLRNADDIDRLICAQLPDPETEPVLYEIIKANMIHGPCGVLNNTCPCMKDGSCSKGYPKSFNDATVMNVDGFPLYHRPDNGRTVRVRNVDLDNRQILYSDIPHDYVFNNNRWKARERGTVISRMYNASIREGEREACLARGLLANDNIWVDTLNEVVHVASPLKVRRTFCTILIHGEPNNPADLWENYKEFMMQDFLRQHVELQAEQMALAHIELMLKQFGKSLDDFNLPHLDFGLVEQLPDAEANRQEAAEIRPLLNNDQTIVADVVLEALSNNDHNSTKLFFLDGPGGTGKTFTYNYIIKEARARSFSVATSSWTGIAATLLDGGKTCHSLFKLPVPVNDGSTCNVKPNSTHAAFLRDQDIFIFDESSMIPKYALEAVDIMLRDICNSQIPFAGKDNIIDAEILTGFHTGQRTLIPRITFCPNDTHLPFQLKRVQFPVRLSYAVTINKSQGQTYDKVAYVMEIPISDGRQINYGLLKQLYSLTSSRLVNKSPSSITQVPSPYWIGDIWIAFNEIPV
ncbi:uncharacterized protein [Clytia hemisphaerica]|uniref:uncharacterized protein n=1 Tax=Clytia hemisphaerica TaxID=252671 RepID=UPI0034D73CDB